MSVCEKIGARTVSLAASDEWNGFADARTALDVAGRDRLEATRAHGAADGGVSDSTFLLRKVFNLDMLNHEALKALIVAQHEQVLSLRTGVLGRENYLFHGSDARSERAAAIYSLIGNAKLNGLNPEAYLRQVLSRDVQ